MLFCTGAWVTLSSVLKQFKGVNLMVAVHGAETQLTMSLALDVAVHGPETQLNLTVLVDVALQGSEQTMKHHCFS